MTQKDKQLLLKDLCGRLPYLVKGLYQWKGNVPFDRELDGRLYDELYLSLYSTEDSSFKPYLRPMSSMTEEECLTLSKLKPYETDAWKYIKTPVPLYIANIEQFDFFHLHHLDWRGLIQRGLALEASEDMYKTE